jgi:NADH:ubiquinone oxidoreductase subunit B-like Fe-S oxidoreductase
MLGKLSEMVDWAQRQPVAADVWLACCAIEMMATVGASMTFRR